MKIQDIISNAYNSDAIGAKQSIYEAISERAMNFLDVKKNDIAIDLFGDVGSIDINESSDSLEEGAVHPADAHRILTQTGGVNTDHFALSGEDVRERMELAKRHGYVAKGDSPTGRSKFYRTSLHLQRQAAKYKQNEEVEQLEESKLHPVKHFDLDDSNKPTLTNRKDSRYTVTKEYTGHPSGEPQHVVRFMDKYVDEFPDHASAAKHAQQHSIHRLTSDIKNIKNDSKILQKEEFEQLDEELSDNAYKLVTHADNDRHLYKSSHVPVAKNLEKKVKAGKYDHEKAKKLWKYHADRAADSYAKEYGKPGQKGHHIFSVADRKEAASHFADKHKSEMELGNFQV